MRSAIDKIQDLFLQCHRHVLVISCIKIYVSCVFQKLRELITTVFQKILFYVGEITVHIQCNKVLQEVILCTDSIRQGIPFLSVLHILHNGNHNIHRHRAFVIISLIEIVIHKFTHSCHQVLYLNNFDFIIFQVSVPMQSMHLLSHLLTSLSGKCLCYQGINF